MSELLRFETREAFREWLRAYLDAKTEAGRSRRLAWMMDRLENNLKPM